MSLFGLSLFRSSLFRSGLFGLSEYRGRGKEPHTLAGPYAMDALSHDERIRFERHLARCDACSQEITGLRETTARLGVATATPAPPDMKDRVLAAARQTRQHVPAVTMPRPRRTRRGLVLAAVPAGAALIAIAVTFGMSSSTANQRLDQAQQRSSEIAVVLTAADAKMMGGQVAGGGSATIVMSRAADALVFTARGLPALPAARVYELWLVGPGGDRPAGMLPQESHGMTGPVIAGGLRQGDRLMLSVEPAQGAAHPTTRMMLDIHL
jgi:anti-sigma-K factor RskA